MDRFMLDTEFSFDPLKCELDLEFWGIKMLTSLYGSTTLSFGVTCDTNFRLHTENIKIKKEMGAY